VRKGWPLIGRREELDRVIGRLVHGEAAALVVDGPAGVGKTRLASEAVRAATGRGVTVHRVPATRASASIPFGACAALLPPRVATATEAGLLRVVAAELVAGAPGRVAVWADDAHLLDPASAALLHHLAVASPVFVLLTLRAEEAPPDAITALVKDEPIEQVSLGPLGSSEIVMLLEEMLEGQVDGALAAHLTRLCEGNPLQLHELVTAAHTAHALSRVSGIWRSTGPIFGRDLPMAVRDRLNGLTPRERDSVELVALAEPVDLDLAEELLEPEVAARLDRHGLLTLGGEEVVAPTEQDPRAVPSLLEDRAHEAGLADARHAAGHDHRARTLCARRSRDVLSAPSSVSRSSSASAIPHAACSCRR
jgi:hypothetical protein